MGPVADSANPDRILSCQNHAPPPVPPPLSSKSCGFPRYQSNARRIGAEQEASLEETEALRPTEAFPIFPYFTASYLLLSFFFIFGLAGLFCGV
ncbi:hypothetical protein LOS78_00400 [Paracoccus sp. MA]|uniref:hypothetical protein n=2 Tax=unclassified Paracoccus (in: a-proteobacteria) TaxID=2688777 RepID=UPI001E378711|nr:hypothetical protein [Paracoccus sp. MA]UFM63987.1 hypothetical protein LOS78_00400 [Paracoccus sp. MA]